MPEQDLRSAPEATFDRPSLSTRLARAITFGGAAALTAHAAREMLLIVSVDEVTVLQWVMVALFGVTFGWIALAATSALAGVLLGSGRRHAGPRGPLTHRTVLLMPVYNEDPAETFGALYAMGSALVDRGVGERFEIFVISDSTDAESCLLETAAVHALRRALGGRLHVWYRRRPTNPGKKAGNVQEFVRRWGRRYDFMVILDADSLMDPEALLTLAHEMAEDPRCGILQTLPRLQGADTLFGRLQQFASVVYGPVVARGITAWQGDDGNYWGHNAILRIEAFAAAAGLPRLGGRPPFGGEILSHDFVEAALVRRAGWSVRMLPTLEGSWELPPPSLLDVAARDRRWAQGNLQHLGVISARGLRWPSRVHLAIGVMSYLASPLWLGLIVVGMTITGHAAVAGFDYFTDEPSLFPRWPVFDSERMVALFVLTMGVLLTPKLLGLLRACGRRALRHPLECVALCGGALVELILSMLYAPMMMLIHSQQIGQILRGRDSGWSRQQRSARAVDWRTLMRRHGGHMGFGLVASLALLYLSPPLLAWMSPTLLGLLLAIPLSALSGSRSAARLLRRARLLSVPEESSEPPLFALRDGLERDLRTRLRSVSLAGLLSDGAEQRRHFELLSEPRVPERPWPDLWLRVAPAVDVHEAISGLSEKERLALVTDPALLELMVKLLQTPRVERGE